jgi:3-methyladenine DNA glycosylase AlkD
MGDLAGAVRAALDGAGDPERARAQQAYMRSALPFRGVSSPELRRLLRPVLGDAGMAPADRAGWEAAVRGLWDRAAYREERYAAIAVARMRGARPWQDVATLDLYRHLVVSGAWWDLVDPVAVDLVGPILLRDRGAATPVIRSWAVADDLWLRRTALIAQLKHREGTDVGLLAEAVDANLEGSPFGNEFFVRKAIGWALRQYARTDPAWVAGFVTSRRERLSGLSRREALKHL